MNPKKFVITAVLLAAVAASAGAQTTKSPAEDVAQAILRLPYYGPFDVIGMSYDKGTVTLTGDAYALGLKRDAERAVTRVAGVDRVINQIAQLPPSPNDDNLRWRTFYAIYSNDFLSRYAPGGGILWGHRYAGWHLRGLGQEPIGNYPIHIIVKNGRIKLIGSVDSETDKNVANIAARGVAGSFGVDNQITVEQSS